MNIEKSQIIQKSQKVLFENLSNPNFFETIMPQNLQSFSVLNEISFSFILLGMPEISLEIKEKTLYSQIKYGSLEGKTPFKLNIFLSEIEKEKTEVKFEFSSNLNPMLSLMVKNPLEKLLSNMLGNL